MTIIKTPVAGDDGKILKYVHSNAQYEPDTGLADHLADTAAAHAASAVSFSASGTIAATTVQAAVAELDSEFAARADVRVALHADDASAAHAASAISFDDTDTSLDADDLQEAVAELDDVVALKVHLAHNATTSLPAAAVGYRSQMAVLRGGADVADVLYVCLKGEANGYSWVQLAEGAGA